MASDTAKGIKGVVTMERVIGCYRSVSGMWAHGLGCRNARPLTNQREPPPFPSPAVQLRGA